MPNKLKLLAKTDSASYFIGLYEDLETGNYEVYESNEGCSEQLAGVFTTFSDAMECMKWLT